MNRDNVSQSKLRPLLIAIAAGVAVGLTYIPIANASSNPFSAEKLSSGYNLAGHQMSDKADNGKCGTGKCGPDKKDAKNGADKNGDKDKDKDKGKGSDGKCGTGKCGS